MQGGEWLTPGELYAIKKELKDSLETNRALKEENFQLREQISKLKSELDKALAGAWN